MATKNGIADRARVRCAPSPAAEINVNDLVRRLVQRSSTLIWLGGVTLGVAAGILLAWLLPR